MRHNYDCEVYELADLLKDMMKHEEEIENYDLRKQFAIFVDDLIAGIESTNDTIRDLETEARSYAYRCEALEDELYYERDLVNELREKIADIDEAIKNARGS